MFDWIRKYFQQNSADVIHPLYLQHEGKNRHRDKTEIYFIKGRKINEPINFNHQTC